MKQLGIKLIWLLLPVGLIIGLTNYFVDPANLFSSQEYVSGIAAILSKHHNVNNIANYDERLLQESMVRNLKDTPDIVVLGSSRIMEIGTSFYTGKKVLNCGVSHANINDVVAIVGLLDSVHKLPAKIVLNVDPFLVCKGGSTEWQSIRAYFDYLATKLHMEGMAENETNKINKLFSLVSFSYFEKSLNFLSKGNSKNYEDVGEQIPQKYGRFFDGTICYPDSYTHSDSVKVASDALDAGNRDVIELDPDRVKLLNKLLDFIESKKIELEFVMLPFHSQYYTTMNRNQQSILVVYTKLFDDIAKRRHIKIKGGFDVSKYDIPASEFYDTYHCSKDAIKKVLAD